MHPKDAETREKVAYPTMRKAFGVSCPLTVGAANRVQGAKNVPRESEADLDLDDSSNPSGSVSASASFCTGNHPLYNDTFDPKVPIRHMSTIVKEIFLTLFKDQPVVILIEEAQNLDEASWRILLSFMKVKQRVYFVLTEEPIECLISEYKTAGSDSSIGELIFPDSTILYDWIAPYLKKLTFDKKLSYILLPEFTFPEVRSYLATTLKMSQWQLPSGLDSIVYNLCGGSPYW